MSPAPCKFDHNGECLICDCWLEHCAHDRYLNKDYKWESKEELEEMFEKEESKADKSALEIILDSLTDDEWQQLKLKADSRKAFQASQVFQARRRSAIEFGDWILKHNVVSGYDDGGSACWVVPDGNGECFTTFGLYAIYINGTWDDLEDDEDE